MQQNNSDQPPSLSQLLRESYLAEARAQQRHSEMSGSDASSSRLQIYTSLKGKAEDSVGQHDPQFPDLSAFLSQEELDKSVNLARQAIGHEAREERAEVKPSVALLTLSNISTSVSSSGHPTAPPSTQPAPELKELPATHTTFTADRKLHKTVVQQENMTSNTRDPSDGFNDFDRSASNNPYGPETQSKKEFLNKAADFIEELSSLFKANSSKRVRPRVCKSLRSRNQNKNQNDGTIYPLGPDNRERCILSIEVEKEGPSPAGGHKQEAQLNSGIGHVVFKDSRITEEQQHYSVSQEVKEEEEAETETPYPAEASSEPPFFIQKLKSREVPEGSKVQLECIVQGLPVPEVRWFCEGKELENSPDIQIITNGELHSLIIAEAFEEDTGRYSCFASNFCGTDSTSAEIYVEGASSTDSEGEQHFEHVAQRQRKSSPPSSSQTPSQEENSQSQPAAATKEPAEEHNSPATYKSIPDLLVSTLATTLQVQESSTTPTVDPVQEEATPLQGFHTLTPGEPELLAASLPLNSVLPLTQTNLPEFFTSQTTDYDYPPGLNSQPIMAAPVFTKGLQDLHASEGQPVVLESHVKGVPSPQVDWFREGQPIQDSPDYRILQKMGICTLVIAEVFHEDSGMFTCTASNKYGTVSSTAALRVKGNGSDSNHLRPRRIQEPPPVNPQPEAAVTNSIKPHSSTIRLDPLISSTSRLDPPSTSTLRLDPHSSSMLRPDPFHTSLPSLRPSSLSGSSSTNSGSTSFPDLEPTSLHQNPPGSDSAGPDLSHPKPFTSQSAVEASPEQEAPSDKNPKVKGTPNHQNGRIVVVPLPDPPPNSCLKTGTQTNHKDSRVGLHVHFKLPEDEEDQQSQSSQFDEDNAILANKEPPPVLAKPKLDPAQLQILHNQVLMEQQQEPEFQAQTLPQAHRQIQIEVQGSSEGPLWSPRMHRDPMTFQVSTDTMSPPQQMPSSAPPLTTAPPLSSAAALNTTFLPLLNTYPTRASSLVTSPQPVPQLKSVPPLIVAPVTQMKTIHTSHLNLSPAALAKTAPLPQYYPPPAAKLSTVLAEPTLEQITSPTALLRSTHASLMNLTATSHSFNYAWPKELIATQTFSPVRSPSPTESPVPLLQELAAELNSSAASSPTLPPFSPPATILPTRVLMSPTSPPSLMSSPTPVSTPFLNSVFALRAQSPPQAASPTSSSSTPSPIQNPVAFLSSVLPSLTPSQPTNSMGLPRGAPLGLKKTLPKVRLPTTEDLRESRETVLHDIEKKLTLKNNTPQFVHQQKLSFVGKTASRPLGPNIPATVINYDEEYKVSNFEQRLMSEIEFRLERTPVEESDDEVQHDDVPTGKCIAPLFDKKLKNFRAMEGVPVTFSCKVVGIPFPKVYWFKDGKQILRKNTHYKKIREGDGTCALYIECTNNNDDGNYTIMAANPQGRISCSGHLIVQTGPPRNRLTPIHSQRVRTRIQEVEGEQAQEHFFQPHFLQTPGDMLAHEGKLCRLDCKVSGLPNPELMWLVNGRPIYPDLYHKMIVRENGIHSLVIDPVTQNDTGTYTCIASNKAGQSSFCLELKVVEREIKYPPQFVEKLQNTGIPDGTPVRLECQVVGMPPPLIFWKKDNESILRTKERFSMTQDATGYVCLLIQPTTKDDAGWYTMSAKNEAGIVSCTCRLDIYAQWHQSVPAPMKMAPCTGSRYAALTGQGLDIKSALPTSETNPILFSSSPPEVTLESEEL